ncbi:uncharacterized protein LY79DRAFT_673580 [Colletotrichum navitas]|uniref:Uncharacterized protein n=1 Tax=Colletotrichum navitas TaxID=681940 RepID=A0AAD8PP83_9PEZI|nr:uncharacterized protein LY79DRAFT_673580 [Colletotrichum navitas]KAK1573483.1 hypothetical protein LY79DRAFT_673580 [Colletotrichum navitas]
MSFRLGNLESGINTTISHADGLAFGAKLLSIINLGSCECLICILNLKETKFTEQSADYLWRASDGILYGTLYARRALEAALKCLKEVDIKNDVEDGTDSGITYDGVGLNSKSAVENQAGDNRDDDNDDGNMDPDENVSLVEQHSSNAEPTFLTPDMALKGAPLPLCPAIELLLASNKAKPSPNSLSNSLLSKSHAPLLDAGPRPPPGPAASPIAPYPFLFLAMHNAGGQG